MAAPDPSLTSLAIVLALGVGCGRSRRLPDAGADTSAPLPVSVVTAPSLGTGVNWVTTKWGISTVAIDHDAVEDIVGPCTDPTSDAPFSLCAFDGATFRMRWRTAPLGSSLGAHAARQAILGRSAVIADPVGVVHVLDLETGTERASAKLLDRAEQVCTPTESPDRLWIAVAGAGGFLFDPAKGALTPASRPRSCPKPFEGSMAECMHSVGVPNDRCVGVTLPPEVPGFRPERVGRDGLDGVALGSHSPGTSYPMVAGFEVVEGKAGKLRWQRPVFPGDPLAGPTAELNQYLFVAAGRAVTIYGSTGTSPHVVAFDAKTGAPQWDTPSQQFFGFHASATRVYVMRWSRLEVLDAKSGRFLGAIGTR